MAPPRSERVSAVILKSSKRIRKTRMGSLVAIRKERSNFTLFAQEIERSEDRPVLFIREQQAPSLMPLRLRTLIHASP